MKPLKLTLVFITLILLVPLTACNIWGDPPPRFTLALNPEAITLEQGESKSITVTITPKFGFKGALSVMLESPSLTASPLTIAEGATSGTLTVTAKADAPLGASTAKVTGSRVTGSRGQLTSSDDLQVSVTEKPRPILLSGQVQNYTGGVATLTAMIPGTASSPEVKIATGNISADGSFSITFPPNLEDNLLGLGTTPEACPYLEVVPTLYKTTEIVLSVFKDDKRMGRLNQASNADLSSVSEGKYIAWVYSDQRVSITGKCVLFVGKSMIEKTFDIHYAKGWNFRELEFKSSVDPSLSGVLVENTRTITETDLPWFFINEQVSLPVSEKLASKVK